MAKHKPDCVYLGDALKSYGIGDGHPIAPDRMDAFWIEPCDQRIGGAVSVLAATRSVPGGLILKSRPVLQSG